VLQIPVFYHPGQVHDPKSFSKSPLKPKLLAERIEKDYNFHIVSDLISPIESSRLKLIHDHGYIDGLMAGTVADGFGNASKSDFKAIRTTVGNFVTAAEYALTQSPIVWSLTSGFHHATHKGGGGFCTIEGLTLAAFELRKFHNAKTLIVDEDLHYGNGCVDVIKTMDMGDYCTYHQSRFTHTMARVDIGAYRKELRKMLVVSKPDIIMYQAGADNWIGDTMSGNLSLGQLYKRDLATFQEARDAGVPVVCNLAGGYAQDYEDTLSIHMTTGDAMKHTYILGDKQ